MQIAFASSWFLLAICLVAVAFVVVFNRQREVPAIQSDAIAPTEFGPTIELQLVIVEMAVVRKLIGPSMAEGLIAGFIDKLAANLHFAKNPEVIGDAIILGFRVTHDFDPGQIIEQVRLIASQPIKVESIEFCFNAEVNVMATSAGTELNFIHKLLQAPPSEANSFSVNEFSANSSKFQNKNFQLLKEFSKAIADNRIFLAYQPKLDLRSNAIDSVEALLRWKRKDGELVNTGDLIDLLEKTGTIKTLTVWVIRQAVADSERLFQTGHPITIYVNISGGLLAGTLFADMLLDTVCGQDARIGIEITETAVIADPEVAIANLHAIAQAGIPIAIDDFGAGLSSLEYLQRLPASELKIDRSFIAKLSSSHRNPLIVRATIDLAHALEMRVTAEGVDDPLSIALLRIMGCDMAQGFLVSPALSFDDLTQFLAVHRGALLQSESPATPMPVGQTLKS